VRREFRIGRHGYRVKFRRLRADTRGNGQTALVRLVLLWAAVFFLLFWLAHLGR